MRNSPLAAKSARSRVAVALPRGACDCHVHVFGAAGQYAFAENRTFMPSPATHARMTMTAAAVNRQAKNRQNKLLLVQQSAGAPRALFCVMLNTALSAR